MWLGKGQKAVLLSCWQPSVPSLADQGANAPVLRTNGISYNNAVETTSSLRSFGVCVVVWFFFPDCTNVSKYLVV